MEDDSIQGAEVSPRGDQRQTDEQKPGKVAFTEEQQARVNELIREAMGRAGREAKQHLSDAEARYASLEMELTALRTKQKADPSEDLERLHHEAKQLKSALAERDRLLSSARAEADGIRKQVEIE